MKVFPYVGLAVLAIAAVGCAQNSTPAASSAMYESAVSSGTRPTSVVGVVRNYDPGSGTIRLEDGTTYRVPQGSGGQQMPTGLTVGPVIGQTVRITYVAQAGQRIVTDLEPEPRGDTGERQQ
jgi:hypothetical protein